MEARPGLGKFDLTLEQAIGLPRGKRRVLAGYLVHFGCYEDARDLLEQVAAQDPTGMLYRMWLVYALLGCGNFAEADCLSAQLLMDFPDKWRVASARAEVLMTLDQPDAAYELLHGFSDDPRKDYSYWNYMGVAAQRRGFWSEAREALSRALAIHRERRLDNPDEEEPRPIYLWAALVRQGEHDGEDVSEFREDLERMRLEEEQKVRDALAKPDSKTRDSRSARPRRCVEVERERPAASIEPVSESPSDPELERHLHEYFGFESFRPGQQQVMRGILDGGSVLAVMPTGAGKSLCFQLPAMLMDGVTLVVSPLIALMKDQLDGLPAPVQRHVTLINSTLEGDEIDRRLREIRNGRYKLVYVAPERLRQRPFLHALKVRGVSLVVVDEAHCVSMWGHDFRPDYLFIGGALEYLGDPSVLAMTATADPEMRNEISNHFNRQLSVVSTGTYRENLFLESVVVRSDEEKMRELIRLCMEIEGSGIVYVRSRQKTEVLARLLRREGVRAAYYHAGLEDRERVRAQEDFMDGGRRVMCATVAFGMGIDKPDVRFVIHYSPPQSLENYYQEAGRAGRDGKPSRCILLSTPSDKALISRWTRDELMDVGLPRRCYAYLRELTRECPFAAVHPDDLQRELEQDETRVRAAVATLEDLRLVRRHLDIPASATVGLTPKGAREGDEEFAAFCAAASLRVDQRVALDAMELSRRTSVKPDGIEGKLLEWRDRGWLSYWGSGRVMLLERLPAPKDAKRRLEETLSKYARARERRAEVMFRYVESGKCRHDLIAAHFGEPKIEECASCDSCAPRESPFNLGKRAKPVESSLTDDEKRLKILETVRMVSGMVGYTGLVRVLKGSVASSIKRDRCPNFGILENEPKTTIERCVRELLEGEYIRRDDSEYRLIELGPKGWSELRK